MPRKQKLTPRKTRKSNPACYFLEERQDLILPFLLLYSSILTIIGAAGDSNIRRHDRFEAQA